MDEEELFNKLDEAIGKTTALICMQTAMATALHVKGVFTNEDMATLPAVAQRLLDATAMTDGERIMGDSALRGWSKAWSQVVTKN